MAFDTTTFSALKSAAEHAVGGGIDTTRTSAGEIVNNAINYVAHVNPWSWRMRKRSLDITATAITSMSRTSNVTTVTKASHGLAVGDTVRIYGAVPTTFNSQFTVASVPTSATFTVTNTGDDEAATTAGSFIPGFIELPSEFEAVVTLRAGSNTFRIVQATSPDEIARMRQVSWQPYNEVWWYLGWAPQIAATNVPVARLEIYPTPTSASTDYLVLTYNRLIPKLSSDTDVPDVPPPYHLLLKQGVRAFAEGEEMDLAAGPNTQKFLAMLPTYIAMDGQSDGGGQKMRGGLPTWRPTAGQFYPPGGLTA